MTYVPKVLPYTQVSYDFCANSFATVLESLMTDLPILNHTGFSYNFCANSGASIHQASFDHVKVGPTPVLALHNL